MLLLWQPEIEWEKIRESMEPRDTPTKQALWLAARKATKLDDWSPSNQAIWLADRDRLFRLTRAFQLSRQEKFLEIFYTAKNNQKKTKKNDTN